MSARVRRAVAAREPSTRALASIRWLLLLTGWFWRLVMRLWVRVEVVGKEHLRGGPLLILANHSHVLDPFVLALHCGRPLQFMVTEPAMFERPLARLVAWTGQVPKRKLESDTRSLRLLKKWSEVGGAVVVFPEGRFSWDGRLLPLQAGLNHLVHYLDIPVVIIRQINGDRFWPPWAKRPRKTTVRLEVDAPIRFRAGDDIESEVARRLWVDPESCARFPVKGDHLAAGLSRLLRLCPACTSSGSLTDARNQLVCSSCDGRWDVGCDNRLRRGHEEVTVGEALQRNLAYLTSRWKGSPSLESCGPVVVMDATTAIWSQVAEGTLVLDRGHLTLGPWSVDLRDVLAHTIDFGHLVMLRTRKQRLAMAMPHDSRAVWSHAIDEVIGSRNTATPRQREVAEA